VIKILAGLAGQLTSSGDLTPLDGYSTAMTRISIEDFLLCDHSVAVSVRSLFSPPASISPIFSLLTVNAYRKLMNHSRMSSPLCPLLKLGIRKGFPSIHSATLTKQSNIKQQAPSPVIRRGHGPIVDGTQKILSQRFVKSGARSSRSACTNRF
jgi:hypothetical protein